MSFGNVIFNERYVAGYGGRCISASHGGWRWTAGFGIAAVTVAAASWYA